MSHLPSLKAHDFALRLGPVSTAWIEGRGTVELERRLAEGRSPSDAVLGAIFMGRTLDERLAGEFWSYLCDRLSMAAGNGCNAPIDDAVQSTIASVLENNLQLEFWTEDQFLNYLVKRVEWKTVDQGRDRRGCALDTGAWELIAAAGQGPASQVAGSMAHSQIIREIHAMPPRERTLILERISNENITESAMRLGMTPGACRKAANRAMQALRKRVDPEPTLSRTQQAAPARE